MSWARMRALSPWTRRFAGQPRREARHREALLEDTDVDVRPIRGRILGRVLRDPRHIDVEQDADVGLRDMLAGEIAREAGRVVWNIEVQRIELEHANARQPGKVVDQLRGRR